MRKLMMGLALGLMLVGLLAMVATPAMAQFADPLTLAASGVLLPFFSSTGNVSILEVASPVGQELNLHFIFFNATCARGESFPVAETTNGVQLYNVATIGAGGADGLVAIADDPAPPIGNGFDLFPLQNPLHTRMYWFNAGANIFRVLEPILVDTYDGVGLTNWVPLRTAATFFAPIEGPLKTDLIFICPRSTIGGPNSAAFPWPPATLGRFPTPSAGVTSFSSGASALRARVYRATNLNNVGGLHEEFLRDWNTTCDCLTTKVLSGVGALSTVYVQFATFTEVETDGTYTGFTGYKALTLPFPGSGVDFFGRLSNGNAAAIRGGLPNGLR